MDAREAREQAGEGASRWFAAGIAAALAVFAAACLAAATREWFQGDDFFFLTHVRESPPWSWLDVRRAIAEPWWNFYRPVGMESYYYVGLSLFGLSFPGFVALALAVTLGTAVCVQRIAVALGFDARIAAVTAALAITRPPPTDALFVPYAFQYTAAIFFYALAAAAFCRYLRGGGAGSQAASCTALVLGVFCNEVVLTLPGVLGLLSLFCEERAAPRPALLRALRRTAPQIALVAAYLVFRFGVLPPPDQPPFYDYVFGWNVPRNLASMLWLVVGGAPGLAAAVLLTAGSLAVARRSDLAWRPTLRWLAGVNALCLVWTLLAMAPYAPLLLDNTRWAAPAATPLCLLFGSYLELLWRSAGRRRPRALALALGALLLVSLPFATFREHTEHPVGLEARRLYDFVRTTVVEHELTTFVVLWGADGTADRKAALRFNWLIRWGPRFVKATDVGKAKIAVVNLALGLERELVAGRCVYLVLEPDGSIEVAERGWLERTLSGPLARSCLSRP